MKLSETVGKPVCELRWASPTTVNLGRMTGHLELEVKLLASGSQSPTIQKQCARQFLNGNRDAYFRGKLAADLCCRCGCPLLDHASAGLRSGIRIMDSTVMSSSWPNDSASLAMW
jgi:hypothetical protein